MPKSILLGLMLCAAVFVATAAGACEICDDMSHPEPGHTHVWCDFPPDNSWGYDECFMKTAPDGGETCWTGTSMCYYTEREGGGGGSDGGGGGGDGGHCDYDESGYCPAWCGVCNLVP